MHDKLATVKRRTWLRLRRRPCHPSAGILHIGANAALVFASAALAGGVCTAGMPAVSDVRCVTPEGGKSPVFFPDGKRLAFIREMPDGRQFVCVLDLAAGQVRRFDQPDTAQFPRVSPDGKYIACLSGPIFARQVWLIGSEDGQARQVTRTAAVRTASNWIDAGKRLAFAEGIGAKQRIVAVAPFASEPQAVTIESLGRGVPTFSPSGKLVALTTSDEHGTSNLRILDADGSVRTDIPPVPVAANQTTPVRGCFDPAFSGDERYLVYVRSDIQPASDLYLRDLATGAETPLTADRADNQSPAVAPDGRSVAFVAAKGGQAHKVYLLTLSFPLTTAPASQPTSGPRE